MQPVRRQKEIDMVALVTTPENVQFEFRIAGFARRLPAFLLDFVFRAVFIIALGIILNCAGLFTMSQVAMATVWAILFVTFFVMSWFYGAFFEYLYNGQTPGKRVMGIRTVMADGRSVSLVAALVRNLCRTADIMPVYLWLPSGDMTEAVIPIPLFLFGGICMVVTGRFQRLGDIAANTIVVTVEPEYINKIGDLRDKRMDEIAASLPLDYVLAPTTVQTLSLYIDRRQRLNAVQREEICAPFVDAIRSKYDLPKEHSNDLIVCALHYREFYMRDDRIDLDNPEKDSKRSTPSVSTSELASPKALSGT